MKKRRETLAEKVNRLSSDNRRLRLGSMSSFDYERLVAWIKNPDRKQPMFAFTAGAARDAANAIVESGVLVSAAAAVGGGG